MGLRGKIKLRAEARAVSPNTILWRDTRPELDGEEWRPLTSVPGWRVSSLGRLMDSSGMIRRSYVNGDYLRINVRVGGVHDLRPVHQLVAEGFLGPCPKGYETHHKGDNRLDNRACKLEYVMKGMHTRLDRTLRPCRGPLAPEIVVKIRELRREGLSQFQIAKLFGISQPVVSRIVNNQSYMGLSYG